MYLFYIKIIVKILFKKKKKNHFLFLRLQNDVWSMYIGYDFHLFLFYSIYKCSVNRIILYSIAIVQYYGIL